MTDFEVVTITFNAQGEKLVLEAQKAGPHGEYPVRLSVDGEIIASINMEEQRMLFSGRFAQLDGEAMQTSTLMLVNSMMAASIFASALTSGTGQLVAEMLEAELEKARRKAGGW